MKRRVLGETPGDILTGGGFESLQAYAALQLNKAGCDRSTMLPWPDQSLRGRIAAVQGARSVRHVDLGVGDDV